MAAPALIDSITGKDTFNTSLVLSTPATPIAIGNKLLARIACISGGDTITPPAGWTAVQQCDDPGGAGDGNNLWVFERDADGTDVAAASYTFTLSAALISAWGFDIYEACTITASAANTDSSTIAWSIGTLTPTGPDATEVLAIFANDPVDTATGFTTHNTQQPDFSSYDLILQDGPCPSAPVSGATSSVWDFTVGLLLEPASAPPTYTLTAGSGSFAIAGQNASLVYTQHATYTLAPTQGSFAVTGYDAGLTWSGAPPTYTLATSTGFFSITGFGGSTTIQYQLPAALGSLAIAGQAAGLAYDRVLSAAQGSFALSGQAVSFTYSGAPPTYTLTAAQGSFALSGQATSLAWGRVLPAAEGGFALAGQDAGLIYGRVLGAGQGSFAFTGQDANLAWGRVLSASQGSFAIAGFDAVLMYSGAGAPTYTLTAAQGSFTLAGQLAGLIYGRALSAAQGGFTVTGQDVGFAYGRVLSAAQGSFAVTGQDAGLAYGRVLSAATGVFAIIGEDAGFSYSGGPVSPTYTLVAQSGALALSGQFVSLVYARVLSAAPGTFNVAGQPVLLTYSGAQILVIPQNRTTRGKPRVRTAP